MAFRSYSTGFAFSLVCVLVLVRCSTVETYLYGELDRQQALPAIDASYFHGESRRPTAADRPQRALRACRGEIRLSSLEAYEISDAAIVCASVGRLERSEELYSLALEKSSGLDQRKIMLNRLMGFERKGMQVLDQDLARVLTDLSYANALKLAEELQNKKSYSLAERIYAFMVPRSSGKALADVYLQKGKFEYYRGQAKAAESLQKSLELQDRTEAHLLLGRIYLESSDQNRAVFHLQKVASERADPEIPFLIAKAEYERKNYESALKWIRKSGSSEPEAIQLHGQILLSLDVAEDPRNLLSALKWERPDGCSSGRGFYRDLHFCALSHSFAVMKPLQTRVSILRTWFGTEAEGRSNVIPYVKGHY